MRRPGSLPGFFADLRLSGVSRIQLWETAGLDMGRTINHNDHIGHNDREGIMVTEVNAVNFRQNLGEMLNQVQYRNDSIVISKDGKPVAALVDAELFARIRRMQDRFDALSRRIAEGYASVPLEEGLAEIDALVARERTR
jgi:prevent-host-death family protein